ncbi:MAG: Tol-Pal system protein TolB [Pseudomonadota bacterium]
MGLAHESTVIALNTHSTARRNALLNAARLGALGMMTPHWVKAQFRVEVSGVGLTQHPFSAIVFRSSAGVPEDIAAIVRADLERSGQFLHVSLPHGAWDESSQPDLTPWRSRGVDVVVVGSVNPMAGGRWDVRYRLWDVLGNKSLGGVSYPVSTQDLRAAAHRIADDIFQKMTGVPGVFSTRIAYTTRSGGRHHLWLADADGQNPKSVLSSTEPIISPNWSADGARLAYVSFEAKKPIVYTHEVATGVRRLASNQRGSNSAPAWSPDGGRLLVTLTLTGSSQIYEINPQGGTPKRLTQSNGIDTEGVYSADGRTIYFVSDRGGSPQIYKMDANGGAAQRVTFQGGYNISPAPSPDGKWLAYVSRLGGGAYRVHVMDLQSGSVAAVSDTSDDENPSFSANSRMLVYGTKFQGRESLMTTTVDGRVKTRLITAPGEVREPHWGPLLR